MSFTYTSLPTTTTTSTTTSTTHTLSSSSLFFISPSCLSSHTIIASSSIFSHSHLSSHKKTRPLSLSCSPHTLDHGSTNILNRNSQASTCNNTFTTSFIPYRASLYSSSFPQRVQASPIPSSRPWLMKDSQDNNTNTNTSNTRSSFVSQSNQHGIRQGDLIAGTYFIEGVIGQGSYGVTYLATVVDKTGNNNTLIHSQARRPPSANIQPRMKVALKALAFRNMQSWKALELFERESKTLSNLSHPSIPRYVDHFEINSATWSHSESVQDDDNTVYILVQEYAPGETLQTLLEDVQWRPSQTQLLSLTQQLFTVLQYLASLSPPVVHRDIKPSNIRVDLFQDPENPKAELQVKLYLVDFGAVADVVKMNQPSMGSTMIGTFGYMAPEQYSGFYSVKSDMYSAAATLLYLISRQHPSSFPQNRLKIDFRDKLNSINPHLEPVYQVIEKCLEPVPEDRFASVDQILDYLAGKRDMEEFSSIYQNSLGSVNQIYKNASLIPSSPGFLSTSTNGTITSSSSSSSSSSLSLSRVPAGSKIRILSDADGVLSISIPANGVTASALATGGFALVWNGMLGVALRSAIMSGAGITFGLFSIPFWIAGASVAKKAVTEVLESTEIFIDSQVFKIEKRTGGKVSQSIVGVTQDLYGAEVRLQQIVQGQPMYQMQLIEGVRRHNFGEGLSKIEQDWLANKITNFISSSR